MHTFIAILDEISKIENIVKRSEDLVSIIALLQEVTQKMLGFRQLKFQLIYFRYNITH